jgi:amino acid adenylation domain-containing protein
METELDEVVEFDPFAGGLVERVLPTSEAQREVWLADRLSPQASLAFNEAVRLELRGVLDAKALHAALDALVARHESLRATLGPVGQELIIGAPFALDLPQFDLRSESVTERKRVLEEAAEQQVTRAFKLESGPLFRAALYRLADDAHVLLMAAHHVVCDGWSWGVIAEDLGALYAELLGEAPSPEAAPVYADYVAWEAREAASPAQVGHEDYWLGCFAGGAVPVLDLPIDRARPAVRSFDSRRIDHVLDAHLVSDVRLLGGRLGASLFSALFSGFAALLHRLSGQDDLVIGVPSAGQSASGLHGLVGHCVNLLPVRVAVDPSQPWEAFVRQTGSTVLDAFEHQTLTYGTLLKKLPVARDPSRLPLVSVMFNLDQAPSASSGFPGLRAHFGGVPRRSENFELFLNAVPTEGGGLRLECQYNTQLFDAVSIERWLRAYEALLRSAVQSPARSISGLGWLSEGDLQVVRALQPMATFFDASDRMHSGFERQALVSPDAVALSDERLHLSYRELHRRANRLAHALRARGVRRGQHVGLCLPRSAEMVVALLAVLKAGATYVPLDPGFPAARLAYYAQDAGLALLITESSVVNAPLDWRPDAAQRVMCLDRDTAWLNAPDTALPPSEADATAQDAAYIIYTSGSTGQPKGVCVPHRAVVNFLGSMREAPGLSASDKLAAVTTLSFDIAVLELMLPLSVGAETVVLARETLMDGMKLDAFLRARAITTMQATPGLWRMLLDAGWAGHAGFKALVGGEAFPPDLAQALLSRCAEVWNLYGPTETTVWSTAWRVESEVLSSHGMSIGRPIANTQVWVLNEALQPCPQGVPGELCIGGDGVTLGYHERPELNADRFVADPFNPGARLYRTGDRGRWRNDGLLEHLGRIDSQVKVRGYRIELGEIEAACKAVEGVAESVVAAREDRPGDVRLVAYLRLVPGAAVNDDTLRNHLAGRLPDYMLPQHVVRLDAIPRLPNGKIDRRQLPAPDMTQVAKAEHVRPRNETEAVLLAAMESVLSLPGLGVHDDFFALGGHSLLAARLTSQLNRELQLNLPLRTLFESPTAEKLALAVEQARGHATPARAPIVHRAGRTAAPLTPMQERVRFLEAMHPGRVVYNTPSGHRLRGRMDLAAFEGALREVVQRQPVLRTCVGLAPNGTDRAQHILESLDVPLPYVDLTHLPVAQREPELLRRMQAIIDTPFDLFQAPLFRVELYKLADEEHAFLFMPHHLIWDGWSFDLLYEELAAIYSARIAGRPSPLPPLAVTYGDYAEWQAEWMRGPEFDAQIAYWKQRYSNAPTPVAPRTEKPRRRGMTGEGAAEWVRIDTHLTERLRAVARRHDVTLNMLMMAVYALMMSDVIGSPSVVLGMPVRGRLMAELELVMGFFNNLLPVSMTLDGSYSLAGFLRLLKQDLLQVFSHQDVPFERLALEPEVASRSQAGLYQALFSYQDARGRTRQWGELQHETILLFQKGATEDLGLWLMEVPNGLEGGFIYNADLYAAHTAVAFRQRYLEMLRRLVDDDPQTLGELVDQRDSLARVVLQRLSAATPEPVSHVEAPRPVRDAGGVSVPLSTQELAVAEIWASLLNLDRSQIGPEDGFFELGGSSLMAMAAMGLVEKKLGVVLPPSALVTANTLRQFAQLAEKPADHGSLVKIRSASGRDSRQPVFLVHDADGQTLLYRNLALRLHAGHAVYGLQPLSGEGCAIRHTRITDMAAHYVQEIRKVQPHGPYLLGGLCAGGVIAFEVALQLQALGESIGMIALIDAADVTAPVRFGHLAGQRLQNFKGAFSNNGEAVSAPAFAARSVAAAVGKAKRLVTYEAKATLNKLQTSRKVRALQQHLDANTPIPQDLHDLTVRQVYNVAVQHYSPKESLLVGAVLFRATESSGTKGDRPAVEAYADPLLGWQRCVASPITSFDVPGGHSSMLQEPNVAVMASQMQGFIDKFLQSVPVQAA